MNKKLKIIYFTDTFLPKVDGISISIKNFSELLSLRGHQFIICSPSYGNGDFSRINENIKIERFMSGALPSYPDIKLVLPNPDRIRKMIKEFQPDLIHVHSPGVLGQYGINASEKYGIPIVGTYHTLIAEQDTYISLYRLLKLDKFFMRLSNFDKALNIKDLIKVEKYDKFNITKKIILKICNYFYDRCDVVITPSNLIKEQLLEYGIKKPIVSISNGTDLTRFKGSPKSLPTSPKILHVGRISYEKNCDVVINAFKLIQEKLPNATLTIVGDGPAIASLKLLTEQLKLNDKIHFTGFIDNSQLHTIYPQYDLFMTASTMETQGLVILEAIACGLPAVGVRSYAIPELIHEGKNGLNAEPFQPKQLAEKALSILMDKSLYEKFSQNSILIASEHDINNCTNKLEEFYIQMISNSSKKKKTNLLNFIL